MAYMIEITLEIWDETEKAYMVSDDGETHEWIPKSQVDPGRACGPGDTVPFQMPEWLAEDKGFV
jgi:hypothetical protein